MLLVINGVAELGATGFGSFLTERSHLCPNSLRERDVSFAISGAPLFGLVFRHREGSAFGVAHAGVAHLDLPYRKLV